MVVEQSSDCERVTRSVKKTALDLNPWCMGSNVRDALCFRNALTFISGCMRETERNVVYLGLDMHNTKELDSSDAPPVVSLLLSAGSLLHCSVRQRY